jgi:hypothetical protein
MFFKKYGKMIIPFCVSAAALVTAAAVGGFSAAGNDGAELINFLLIALLVLNTAGYAVSRAASGYSGPWKSGLNAADGHSDIQTGGAGYLFYFALNLLSAAAFQLVAVNLVNFYAATTDMSAAFGLMPLSILGAFASLFVYYAALIPTAFLSRKGREGFGVGYIKEAALYLAVSSILFINSYIISNFIFALSGAVLLLLLARDLKSRALQITSAALVGMTAVLFAVFFIGFHSLTDNFGALKIAFYVMSFVTAVLWLVHSLFAYKFFGLGTTRGERGGLKYVVLSLIPVLMLVQYAFGDIDKTFAAAGAGFLGENYFFLNIVDDAANPVLYAITAVIILARIAFAAAAALSAFKKPKEKPPQSDAETDELGVSLSFEETLKEKNIDLSGIPNSTLEAIGIPREELFSDLTGVGEFGAATPPADAEKFGEFDAEASQIDTEKYGSIPPIFEENPPYVPPVTERQKPVEILFPPEKTEKDLPYVSPVTERQKPTETLFKPSKVDGDQPFDYAKSLRISEVLSDAGLKAAIDELSGKSTETRDTIDPIDEAESQNVYSKLQTESGIPIAVPYDIRQLNDRAAAAPEDEESKKIDEILNRINNQAEK